MRIELLMLAAAAGFVWSWWPPSFWWFVRFAQFFGGLAGLLGKGADVLNRWAVAANVRAMHWIDRTERDLER